MARSAGRRDAALEIADLLTQVNRSLRRAAEPVLTPHGVTVGQVRLLRHLDRAGAPLRLTEIAERLGVVPRSATSVVDELETGGLVTRLADDTDRRARLVVLTAAGRGLLDEVRRTRGASATSLLARLTRDEQRTLQDLLARLAAQEM